MGRTYGLDTSYEMKNLMSGFVANPMEHAEASKVGLFGVANYTWNIDQFESQSTWIAGMFRLYPRHREAMRVFCAHNSYLLPNGHGYFREESVEIAETANQFISSIAAGTPDMKAVQLLQLEFDRMVSAARELKHTQNPIAGLCSEIQPWLDQFELTGVAGASIMTAFTTEDDYLFYYFFDTVQALYDMRTITRAEWTMQGVRQVDDVEVAAYAMTPVLNAAFSYMNARVYANLSGQERSVPKFTASCGKTKQNVAKMMDSRPNTFWSNDTAQAEGQWYCLDQGSIGNINNICLITGGPRHNDYPGCVQFELSDDGTNWRPVGLPQYGNQAVVNLSKSPERARYVRFRIVTPRKNWLSICEFAVNRSLPPFVDSNITGCNLSAFSNKADIGINRVMEVCKLAPNEYISLELPTPMRPEYVEINLENAGLLDWGHVVLSLESGKEVQLHGPVIKNRFYLKKEQLPAERINALRLINHGDSEQEIKVTIFRIGISEDAFDTDTRVLTDTDIASTYFCSKAALDVTLPVPEGTTDLITVGNAKFDVTNATLTREGDHLRYFKLHPGAKSVRITHPQQPHTFLNEVIFK